MQVSHSVQRLESQTTHAIHQGERTGRAGVHAQPAVIAQINRVRVVAVQAVQVASLQEDDRPVARPVHETLRQDMIDPPAANDGIPGG